jgi:membrane protease YdiL (CAAX protease family)
MNIDNNLILKLKGITKNVVIFLALLLSYIFLPYLIAVVFYDVFNLDKTICEFIGNISYMLLLLAFYFKMFKSKIKDFCSNFSKYFGDSLKYWGIGLAVMFVSNAIMAYVIFPGEIATNEELNRQFIVGNPLLGLFSVAILAPFVEEMIFRFGLREVVGKKKYFPIISALCFGLPHVLTGMDTSFTLNNILQLLYVIPYGALGYAFGYIYNETDNIFCSMSMHFLHNLMCFMVIFFLA